MAGARLAVLLGASTLVVACAQLPNDVAGQRDKEMAEAVQRFTELRKRTPAKDLQVFESKHLEVDVFVRYLGCAGSTPLPAPDQIKSSVIGVWPSPENFIIGYPLVMQVHVEFREPSQSRVLVWARQQGSGAPWEITEIWQSDNGARKSLAVPSTEIQQRANRELPRLLDEIQKADEITLAACPAASPS